MMASLLGQYANDEGYRSMSYTWWVWSEGPKVYVSYRYGGIIPGVLPLSWDFV